MKPQPHCCKKDVILKLNATGECKTDCENFVDDIVDRAKTAKGYWVMSQSRLGWNIASTYTGSSMGDYAPLPAGIPTAPTGFKPILTQGGQNGEVYRHLGGYMGSNLLENFGGYNVVIEQMQKDMSQLDEAIRKGEDANVQQRIAELSGDAAGLSGGDALRDYLNDNL